MKLRVYLQSFPPRSHRRALLRPTVSLENAFERDRIESIPVAKHNRNFRMSLLSRARSAARAYDGGIHLLFFVVAEPKPHTDAPLAETDVML
jgi:hypothetical protein